ncbi:hypothetical protein LM13656_180069 [Listeria monocytogenes]|nr:hypothetical protein LM500008_100049 [Listeria monocytogenes]CUK35315.1 hypothetical protein LM13656_180069 [Listeria monocytogenes]CUK51386.1 hypothetical protein LM500704_110913 [Listeria monocytogenes]CUK92023.1 hypothetical protein LM700876_130045 [Listeria monocytogenes]CUK98059.1 hypothetical protein LM701067_140861 [Listeria monocytogenes]
MKLFVAALAFIGEINPLANPTVIINAKIVITIFFTFLLTDHSSKVLIHFATYI